MGNSNGIPAFGPPAATSDLRANWPPGQRAQNSPPPGDEPADKPTREAPSVNSGQAVSAGHERKLFVDVNDEAQALHLERSLFVPTRLSWRLGEQLTLCLRFPLSPHPFELPVVVVGRRPQSGIGLPAGVLLRLADPDPGLLDLIREIGEGHVADVWGRVQERVRLPARVIFENAEEACEELEELLVDAGAALLLNQAFVRGDRLVLDVVVRARVIAVLNVRVLRIQVQDDQLRTVVVPLDAASRSMAQMLVDERRASHRG